MWEGGCSLGHQAAVHRQERWALEAHPSYGWWEAAQTRCPRAQVQNASPPPRPPEATPTSRSTPVPTRSQQRTSGSRRSYSRLTQSRGPEGSPGTASSTFPGGRFQQLPPRLSPEQAPRTGVGWDNMGAASPPVTTGDRTRVTKGPLPSVGLPGSPPKVPRPRLRARGPHPATPRPRGPSPPRTRAGGRTSQTGGRGTTRCGT